MTLAPGWDPFLHTTGGDKASPGQALKRSEPHQELHRCPRERLEREKLSQRTQHPNGPRKDGQCLRSGRRGCLSVRAEWGGAHSRFLL